MKTIHDFNVTYKRILVRCDFNVPLDDAGNIIDDFKIRKSLPTLQYLLEKQARVIILTHLGKPNGEVMEHLRLNVIKNRLEELLGMQITKTDDCVGKEAEQAVLKLETGKVLLLENVRFHKGETENSEEFAKELSHLADIYINDAFGVCHRAHASVAKLPEFLPHAAGLLLQEELELLTSIVKDPKRPLIAIVGGKKVDTKAAFVDAISHTADVVLVSGLIRKGLIDEDIPLSHPKKIIGPTTNLEAPDIDEETLKKFKEKIHTASTIIWNGPFGNFEEEKYKKGTLGIANAIIESKAFSLVGGGETAEFLHKEGLADKFNHVSPEGGAMLDFLSGEALPGIQALEK